MARLFFGESILDAVTDQLETVIYGALKEDYCPATGRKWPLDSKSSSPMYELNPNKFILPILAEAGFQNDAWKKKFYRHSSQGSTANLKMKTEIRVLMVKFEASVNRFFLR